MEFEGVVFRKLPEQTGTSARGEWKKQDVVFELPGEYSRKVCVTFFGDRAEDATRLNEGDTVQVSANVESREYNGKWYTDVKAWKISRGAGAPAGGGSTGAGAGASSGAGAGAGSGSGAAAQKPMAPASSPMADAPFNEATVPAGAGYGAGAASPVSSADDVDDLPF